MAANCYSTIFVNYGDADRDILTRQLRMLKERYHSSVVLMLASDKDSQFLGQNADLFRDKISLTDLDVSEAVLEYCQKGHISVKEATYIGELSDGDTRLKEAGLEVKNPVEMAESYKKAMEMLQKMITPLKGR